MHPDPPFPVFCGHLSQISDIERLVYYNVTITHPVNKKTSYILRRKETMFDQIFKQKVHSYISLSIFTVYFVAKIAVLLNLFKRH